MNFVKLEVKYFPDLGLQSIVLKTVSDFFFRTLGFDKLFP